MRNVAMLAAAVLAGCQGRGRSRAVEETGDSLQLAAAMAPRDSADSVLLTPRVVSSRTVLVYWLAAADTFSADDQAAVLDELTMYTDRVAPVLTRHNIALVPTNAETVYVALPNSGRRPIVLSGLDFPFGYVLIDDEGNERIITGVMFDDELLEEIRIFFDLPDTESPVHGPRITT